MNPDRPVHAANVPTPTERPRRQIAHEEIARRAETLWRQKGWPAGQDEAIWLEAESQLQAEAESKPVSGTASRPQTDQPPVSTRRTKTKSRDPSDATPANSRAR
jgi:hypothetical protein